MAASRMQDIPWLAPENLAAPSAIPALDADASPAQRLLHAHLSHGSRLRREAAAFALALTQPAAADAVRDFLQRNKKPEK